MSRETTPPKITDIIYRACKAINPAIVPEYIRVCPEPWAKENECFPNVKEKVRIDGGQAVYGWAIWQWANVMLEAEAHCVWKAPDGELIDITPHNYGEKRILFVVDDTIHYEGVIIPNKRAPLTTSSKVDMLIKLSNTKDEILKNSGTNGLCEMPADLIYYINKLQMEIKQPARANDSCPCGSGLKYKNCCGPYENI